MRVKATREGLIGHVTASGWTIDANRLFVALPSHKALHRIVIVSNPLTHLSKRAEVLDVGPWNIHDDAYVFGGKRPQAESGIDLFGRKTNGAGLDVGEAVYHALGMRDNTELDWEFEPLEPLDSDATSSSVEDESKL